ncbi:MAG: hypothetical protein R3291_01090, partial [Thermoplasmata archaeon]|nr:hypothetical protein [Thermoplasmata archaeon]
MSLLVTDGILVTQDERRRVLRGNLRVEGNTLQALGEVEEGTDRQIDATGCLVVPGFVDGYTRSAHVLLGPPVDVPWAEMEDATARLGENLTKRDLEVAAA